MERNANFIFVGVIALFGLISLGVFAFWLGKYGSNEDKFQSYRTYVSESVAGLKSKRLPSMNLQVFLIRR